MKLSDVHPNAEKTGTDWPWVYEGQEIFYDPTVSWPKISIVTPSFNQGEYIEETIRSVLLQNYPNLEYIIIDGGSTDRTVDIIKKYEPWISYWVSEPDRGQSHAINKGFDRCSGDVFNWLNSDDWYEPESLFAIAKAFIDNPKAYVISGFENHVNEMTGSKALSEGTFLDESLEKTIEWCQVAQPSTFFKISVIRDLYPLSEDLHFIMDGELWLRYLLQNGQENFVKVNKPLVNFRLHDKSKTISNLEVDNFLIERSSIITDLQSYINLPQPILSFWTNDIYKTPKIIRLTRCWELNERYITSKRLRVFFIKKFINYKLQRDDLASAKWGLKQLLKDKHYSFFQLNVLAKLFIKNIIK